MRLFTLRTHSAVAVCATPALSTPPSSGVEGARVIPTPVALRISYMLVIQHILEDILQNSLFAVCISPVNNCIAGRFPVFTEEGT